MQDTPMTSPPRSRFRRYGLRTLLAVMALAAAPCAYGGSVWRQYVFEQEFTQIVQNKYLGECSAIVYMPAWLRWWPGSRNWFERIDTVRLYGRLDSKVLRQLREL